VSKNQQVKAAACRLAFATAQRVEACRLAVGEDETIKTATDLSMVVLENIDFIIFALRKVGGLSANAEALSPGSPALIKIPELSDNLPKMPEVFAPAAEAVSNDA
jgi:hypothetical protein